MAYSDTLTYICHSIASHSIELINTSALGKYLGTLKVFERASTVKLIHGWTSTLSTLCRQGRPPSSLCPRCHITVETSDHVFKCSHHEAMDKRSQCLKCTIATLRNANTPQLLLNTLQYKLSLVLDLPIPVFQPDPSISTLPHCLIKVIRHQNLLGWHLMFCGYISTFWLPAYNKLFDHTQSSPNLAWDVILVCNLLQMFKSIWSDRNTSFHGNSREEQRIKLWEYILEQIKLIYKNPPKLDR